MEAHDLNPHTGRGWRLVSTATGREVVLEAVPGVRYVDRETGEPMEVTWPAAAAFAFRVAIAVDGGEPAVLPVV